MFTRPDFIGPDTFSTNTVEERHPLFLLAIDGQIAALSLAMAIFTSSSILCVFMTSFY